MRVSHRLVHPLPRARSRVLTAVLVVLVWSLAALTTMFVAADTKIGPVLLKLSRGHGIHLGDALVLVLAIAGAGSVTWLLVRRRPFL